MVFRRRTSPISKWNGQRTPQRAAIRHENYNGNDRAKRQRRRAQKADHGRDKPKRGLRRLQVRTEVTSDPIYGRAQRAKRMKIRFAVTLRRRRRRGLASQVRQSYRSGSRDAVRGMNHSRETAKSLEKRVAQNLK